MSTHYDVAAFLIGIVSLLLSAHLVGLLFEKFAMPRVVGEILGGLLLGPSVLGAVSPALSEFLVPTTDGPKQMLEAFYWLGLTLLMFIAGFRIQHRFDSGDRLVICALLASATLVPFAAGWLVTEYYNFSTYTGPQGNSITTTLIIAIAVAVTSIPVISKIFIDLGLITTRFARIVLVTSTIQDILLWAILAIATGLSGIEAGVSTQSLGWVEIAKAAVNPMLFCVGGLLLGPFILKVIKRLPVISVVRSMKLGSTLLWCFMIAALAALLDVNVIFGALIAGLTLGRLKGGEMESEKGQISGIALAFFIPIYFALVGHSIDIPGAFEPGLFIGFLVFSTTVEGGCVLLAMRAIRLNWATSFNFAVAMNTRGGPGIVLASMTYSLGLIDERLFVALVLTAIVTSMLSGVWFKYLVSRGRPLMS